jgi:putative copper export protein
MLPDLLSAGLRGLSFIAMAQAAGALLFLLLFARMLGPSLQMIRHAGTLAAWCALVLLPLQFALEAARMAGAVSGMWDFELQRFALSTAAAHVVALRIIGVILLLVAFRGGWQTQRWLGLSGAVLVAVSFALIGHAAVAPSKWGLMPLIVLHLAVVCFWFGSLMPLILVVRAESGNLAARVVERFSGIAGPVVPLLMASGLVVAAVLLWGRWNSTGAYGLGLLAKLLLFGVLMGFAALNKWRLGPALAHDGNARRRFLLAVAIEAGILGLVLMGTATLTTFASPE